MSDEATLRILINDEGPGAEMPRGAPEGPPQPRPEPFRPPMPEARTAPYNAPSRRRAPDEEDGGDRGFAGLGWTNPPAPEAAFDPVAEAKKRLDREKKLAEIDAEYAKLNPPKVTAFDPVDEARKRLDKEKQAQQVQAEYEKLNPAKPFDPLEVLKKRSQAASQQAQVEEAERLARFQQSAFGKGFAKVFGEGAAATGWGIAAAGAIASFVSAQFTPQGMRNIGRGVAFNGNAGAGKSMLENFVQTLPGAALAIEYFAAKAEAAGQQMVALAQNQANFLVTHDQMLAELRYNEQVLAEQTTTGRAAESMRQDFSRGLGRLLGWFGVGYTSYQSVQSEVNEARENVTHQRGFEQNAANIRAFSPDISMALAQRQIRQQQTNFGEAQFAGPQYREFLNLRTQMEQQGQTLAALRSMERLESTIQQLHVQVGKQNEEIRKAAEAETKRINDDADARKRAAKNDDERLKIEKERLARLERIDDLIREQAQGQPLEDWIRGMIMPKEDENERGRRLMLQDAARNWHIGTGAFTL